MRILRVERKRKVFWPRAGRGTEMSKGARTESNSAKCARLFVLTSSDTRRVASYLSN